MKQLDQFLLQANPGNTHQWLSHHLQKFLPNPSHAALIDRSKGHSPPGFLRDLKFIERHIAQGVWHEIIFDTLGTTPSS